MSIKGEYEGLEHGIYIIDLDSGEKLGLMGIPKELEYNPESSWATLKPFGKNTPNYHFTGAEDTLELELSWFAQEENRLDVMKKVKWLEAMSKADGDLGRPHLAGLVWGELFKKSKWLIFSAAYKLTSFDSTNGANVPLAATQKLVLKRYQRDNRTTAQIIDWQT